MEEKDMPDFFKDESQKATMLENENFEKAKERLNFDITPTESDVLEDTTVPYDFRAEHKTDDDVTDDTFVEDHRFMSVRMHAIGIGILIGVLLAVLLGMFMFDSDEQDDANAEPVIIEGSTRPVKTRPSNPGGMDIPDQDKTVYKRMRSDKVDTQVEVISIAAEKPVQPQIKTKEGGILGAPLPSTQPQPSVSNEEIEWEVLNLKEKAIQIEDTAEEVVPAAEVQQQEEVPVPVQVKEAEKPVVTAKVEPAVQQKQSAPKTESKPATKTIAKPATTQNKNAWHVQLISLRSKAAVNKEWPKILKAHSSLLSGLPHQVKEVNIKGKVFYRLMVGEYKNKKDAQSLCSKLKARKQDCTITK